MNSKIITPVFTGIQQCEALLPPFERACTAAIDVSGGSVQELIYSDKKVTRPGFSNGDAGLMTMRALESLMQNMQDTVQHPAGRTRRQES